jgi:hypothetical protein
MSTDPYIDINGSNYPYKSAGYEGHQTPLAQPNLPVRRCMSYDERAKNREDPTEGQ